MTRQNIGIGTTANDGTGDTLRSAGEKINENFVELYIKLGGDSNSLSNGVAFTAGSIIFEGSTADSFETTLIPVNPTADRIVYIPDRSGTLLLDSASQTLTNKTLTSPILTGPQINDTSSTHRYTIVPAELVANRNIRLPLLTDSDTFTFNSHASTLTNKTLTSPILTTPRVTTAINDVNGAESIRITATSSAVNDVNITNAATGNKPSITATGDDTNITLRLAGKGTGSVEIAKAAYTSATITTAGAASTSATYIICNSGSALAVSLANGTVVGETKIFTNMGAGIATVTPASFASGTSFALAQNEGCQVIWDGVKWYLIGNQSQLTIV